MLTIPVEIKNLIKTDGTRKNFRVHFPNGERADITNENIVSESVDFQESVCSSDTFRFGCAEASVIRFETVGVENIINKTIECFMEYAVPAELQQTYGEWYQIPYGTFVVETCPRNHEDMTHRRVTAYSAIKYMFEVSNFLQSRVLPVPAVHVSMNTINAYVTGNTSAFTEEDASVYTMQGLTTNYLLYDSSGIPYYISVHNPNESNYGGLKRFYIQNHSRAGYKISYSESGETLGSDIGQSVIDWLDENDIELLYDGNGNKIFSSNEEAIKYYCKYFWEPMATETTTDSDGYGIYYSPFSTELNKFTPTIKDDKFNYSENSHVTYIYCLGESVDEVSIKKWSNVNIWASSTTASTVATIPVSGFSSQSSCKTYREQEISSKLDEVAINATLSVGNSLSYERRVSNREKKFYSVMYAYSNAYSNREYLDGWAELNGAFIHSERDGSISMESLDNSNPYILTAEDVIGNAWWDEYDVNPIGTIEYTFTNPFTGYVEEGTYKFGDGPSVYKLNGNKVLESMDFTAKKSSTVAGMKNKNFFYRYTGSESGYEKGDFYYWDGTAWVSGGHYTDIRSIVNFVLSEIFVPHLTSVNFTPIEMDIRGLPFLEAGDAFKLITNDGSEINSYILNHKLGGIQIIEDEITSVSGEIL